jgi:hypothetical protein
VGRESSPDERNDKALITNWGGERGSGNAPFRDGRVFWAEMRCCFLAFVLTQRRDDAEAQRNNERGLTLPPKTCGRQTNLIGARRLRRFIVEHGNGTAFQRTLSNSNVEVT